MTKIKWIKTGNTRTSPDGRFKIVKRMVATPRNGCWRPEWQFTDTLTGWRSDEERFGHATEFAEQIVTDEATTAGGKK